MKELERIYMEHSDRVYRYIYLLVRNKENAEDLTQETFYRAYKNLHTFNQQASMSTWLLKIARNATYDYFRRRKIVQFFTWGKDNDIDFHTLSPESSAVQKEALLELHTAINRLKKDYRDVLILRKVDECTIKEAAFVLGWTEAKVKSKTARALDALKRELAGKEGVDYGSIEKS